MDYTDIAFLGSATALDHAPVHDFPEFAFVGRSNCGKSSMINCLVNRRNLARVSGTPGHTKTLNFFEVNHQYVLVDLPGYGFAARSRSESATWKGMIESYLSERKALAMLILLLDIRRPPDERELLFLDWLTMKGIPAKLVLTKADKLSRNERSRILAAHFKTPLVPLCFSAVTREGKEELLQTIELARLQWRPTQPPAPGRFHL